LTYEPGSFYIADRGYLDFARLYRLHQSGAFFVTRAKKNSRFQRRYSRPVDKTTGLRFDQTVVLSGFYSRQQYPEALRRIGFRDPQTGKSLVFLTNNFTEPALTIAQLYRCRWQVELFFKWIKQHLRIKVFYGTSENAVRIQVWTAISIYVLVAIVRKRLCLSASLYTILQILSLSLFEKTPILQALSQQTLTSNMPNNHNEPCLPGF
jgi:IS4 transposase